MHRLYEEMEQLLMQERDSLKLKVSVDAGVRYNCVRHAILSTPDTFAYAIVSGAMQKPSGEKEHDCTYVRA